MGEHYDGRAPFAVDASHDPSLNRASRLEAERVELGKRSWETEQQVLGLGALESERMVHGASHLTGVQCGRLTTVRRVGEHQAQRKGRQLG